jgi:tRNA(Ile)-lysidine synthase
MKAEFLNYISQKKLCTTKDKILLTVSGGMDSMVMLHLFRECEFNISVAHVNFQLRGEESNGDEEFVKEECHKFSIPFFAKQFETAEFALKNSFSIQMAARELRYTWFLELADQQNFDSVATAHHLNDSIETVLLNFTRGSGLEGLDGIETRNGKIIRPLLFATRKQIELYAKENKIAWHEDSSNASDDYQRNFIRHKIIPLLKELNPSLENSFTDSMDKISGANALKESGIRHWKKEFEIEKNDRVHLGKKGFQNFNNADGLLWNVVKHFGFNLDQCRQIIKSIHGQSGKKFYSHEFELIIDREHLIISKQEVGLSEVEIENGNTGAHLGNYVLKISETTKTELSNDPSVAKLDAEKLQFPLTWRKWKAGDHFHPLGMRHKKNLSDFFIDQKISVTDKETITVLESGGEIVWVVGHRIDDNYKITNSTKRVVKFELISSR